MSVVNGLDVDPVELTSVGRHPRLVVDLRNAVRQTLIGSPRHTSADNVDVL